MKPYQNPNQNNLLLRSTVDRRNTEVNQKQNKTKSNDYQFEMSEENRVELKQQQNSNKIELLLRIKSENTIETSPEPN